MRYVSEINLRLDGDRQKAAAYIPRARVVVGELWNQDIRLGGHNQAFRRLALEAGNVEIEVRIIRGLPPIVRIFASSEAEEIRLEGASLLLLAWYPEGLMITPRNAAYPQGVGLPTRDPTSGDTLPFPTTTANPVFPQVLLNQYANNKYLDKQSFINGTVQASDGLTDDPYWLRAAGDTARDETPTKFRYWQKLSRPLDYADVEFTYDGFEFWRDNNNQAQYPTIAGEYLITEEIVQGNAVQFATRLVEQINPISGANNIFEGQSTTEWYSHRAEEILYPTEGHEEVYRLTNLYRSFALATPVTRMLRGDGNPALIAVAEVARSGDLSHNSLNFRPGFRTADGKVLNAVGVDQTSGENLAAGFTGTSESVGGDVALAWFNSPGHRANMQSYAWDNTATIPGAQHSIGYTEGTITEQTEDIPDINTYPGGTVTGGIWSQVFHKRPTWVPAWDYTHDGDFGTTGWNGLGGYQENTVLATIDVDTGSVVPFQAYFGFRGCRYVLPNSADETKTVRVLAATVYQKDIPTGVPDETVPQLWFRVALLLNDIGEDFINETTQELGDGKIMIFTAPVGVTEANYKDRYGYYDPDPNRAWELEGELDLPFAVDGSGEGWLYPAFGTAAISSDGRKFCFTYQKYRVDTQPLLHRSSTDFTQSLDRDVTVAWFVHIEKEIDGDFVQYSQAPPTATVTAVTTNSTPGNYLHTYTRTLNTTYNYMPVYDAENVLEYVQLSIDDYQTQSTSGHMWRVRKLVFPSGKEVLTDYQFMEDYLIPDDLAAFALTYSAPVVEGETQCFNSVIHHIDPVAEDVVLTRTFLFLEDDTPLTYEEPWNLTMLTEITVDLGTGDDRVLEPLTRKGYFIQYSAAGVRANTISPPVSAGEPWVLAGGTRELRLRTSFLIYNYKSPVGVQASIFIGDELSIIAIGGTFPDDVGWYGYGSISPHVHFFGQYTGGGANQFDPAAYATYDIQGMYNAADYSVSVWQPPHRFFERGKDNMWQNRSVFDDKIAGAMYTDNVSPLYTDFKYIDTTVTRYKDRVAMRCSMTHDVGRLYNTFLEIEAGANGPYATSAEAFQATNYPSPPTDADVVSLNARINGNTLLWANFDLDEAAGISDVTDIAPLGRVV
jgi:hypothetical protein